MEKQRMTGGKFTYMLYTGGKPCTKGIILCLGNSDEGLLVNGAAKYLVEQGCDVVAICPVLQGETYDGWHSFPMEIYAEAMACLKARGISKIGVAGGSTTAMVSLTALSLYPELSLGLIYAGCDFLFEGVHVREGKSGKLKDRVEVPAHGQSSLSYQGRDLPFVPYHLTDEQYHELAYGSQKKYGELNGWELYDHVEAQPEFAGSLIPVENSHAHIHAFSAEDDSLWRTANYMRRLGKRLQAHDYAYGFTLHVYPYGTHFMYPQGMLLKIAHAPFAIRLLLGKMFHSGKQHPRECEQARLDADRATKKALADW